MIPTTLKGTPMNDLPERNPATETPPAGPEPCTYLANEDDTYDLLAELLTFALLHKTGVTVQAGCRMTIDGHPDVAACVILTNSELAGDTLVAAAPYLVATMRKCADDLEAFTAAPRPASRGNNSEGNTDE